MSWVSFITVGMTVILAYAMFTGGEEEEIDFTNYNNEANVVVNESFWQICDVFLSNLP